MTIENTTQATGHERVYPGFDGQRFRLKPGQKMPLLKHDDPIQPTTVADAAARVFDLSNDDDLKDYAAIWDQAAKGEVMISAEERHWCETTQNFKIFLRWADVYLELPITYGRIIHDGRIYE